MVFQIVNRWLPFLAYIKSQSESVASVEFLNAIRSQDKLTKVHKPKQV